MVSGLFLCSGHVLRRVRASSFGGGDALGLSKKWPVLPWVRSRILDRTIREPGQSFRTWGQAERVSVLFVHSSR